MYIAQAVGCWLVAVRPQVPSWCSAVLGQTRFQVLSSLPMYHFTSILHRVIIRSTVNNFVDWPHSGAVMHYSGYVESRDGAVSFSCPRKKQSRACNVFRKKFTVVKGSCLQAAEIENVAV
jgi:hypothetical protein